MASRTDGYVRLAAHYAELLSQVDRAILQCDREQAIEEFDRIWPQAWAGIEWAYARRRSDSRTFAILLPYVSGIDHPLIRLRLPLQSRRLLCHVQLWVAEIQSDRDLEARGLTSLAEVCCDIGRFRTAVRLLERSLRLARSIGSPRVEAAAYLALAKTQCALNQFELAAHSTTTCITTLTKAGAQYSEAQLEAYALLASIYLAQGTPNRVIELLEPIIHRLRDRELGGTSVAWSEMLLSLGRGYSVCAQTALALPVLEEALRLASTWYGPWHYRVALYVHELGVAQRSLGRIGEAISSIERALEIDRLHWGEEHPGVGARYGVLGILHADQGDIEGGIELLSRALALERRCSHWDLAPVYVVALLHARGRIYLDAGNIELAAGDLRLAAKTLGRQHAAPASRRAAVYFDLGRLCQKTGKRRAALALHRRALALRLTIFPSDHPDVIASRIEAEGPM